MTTNKRSMTFDLQRTQNFRFGREPTYQQLPPTGARPASRRGGLCHDLTEIWWAEILCLLGVMTALLAIALTLVTHQNQAVRQWPYRFSINSLVSTYAVVLKGAMLIIISAGISQLKWMWFEKVHNLSDIDDWDQASRGVWGSLILIWRLKARHFVATIGAVVTILALALDPMVQFLVRYDSCNIEQYGIAAQMARSSKFQTIGYHIGAGFNQLPPDFVSAITAGIFKPEPVAVPAICPTGNCTFSQPYHSLGYCGQCEDLSDQLSLNCWHYTASATYQLQNNTVVNYTYPESRCNYTLPDGTYNFLDSADYQQSYFVLQPNDWHWQYSLITNNLTFFNNNTYFTGNSADPFRFENCSVPSSNSSWICAGVGAASCSLKPCIRTYDASIVNGKQQENMIAVSHIFNATVDDDGGSWSAVDVDCLPISIRQQLIDLQYPITNSTEWIGYHGNTDYNQSITGETPYIAIPDICLYQLSQINDNSLSSYLYTVLKGNMTGGPNYVYEMIGPPALFKLFNGGNLSFESVNDAFQDIGDAITSYMRQVQADQVGNYPANGTVWREEICIGIRWPFFILPVVLVVLTLVFFVAMVVKTSTNTTVDHWKDSAIALTFHSIHYDADQRHRQPVGKLDSKRKMASAAKDLKVRLGKDSDQGELFFTVVEQMSSDGESFQMGQLSNSSDTNNFTVKRKPVSATSASSVSL